MIVFIYRLKKCNVFVTYENDLCFIMKQKIGGILMKNPKTLLIIDYTNDFVDTSGALTTGKPGQKSNLKF
ncbi:hypothetical protein PESHB4_12450 [Pediococcus ethanolidurans]